MHLRFQHGELLQEPLPFLLPDAPARPLVTPLYQRRAVQAQPFDQEFAFGGQTFRNAVVSAGQMKREIIASRMEQTRLPIGRPKIAFEFVAGVASVNQIVEVV